MSKFTEKLERIWAREPQPLGFGVQASVAKSLPMVIVAQLPPGHLDPKALNLEDADAVLFSLAEPDKESKAFSKAIQVIADLPWGVSAEAMKKEQVERLIGLGCDFLVFTAGEPPAVLLEHDVGKVLQVDTSLSDSLARAIACLPIDAVLLSTEQWPPTVRLLLDYGRLASLVDKPTMALLPAAPSSDDIEALWEAGVCGVVISELKQLSQAKLAIQSLSQNPKRKKAKKRRRAILPIVTELPAEESEEEEEEI